MRTRAIGTARAALLTAGFVALGVSAISPAAAIADTTSGDDSVLGGNQVNAPISAPVNACGNAVAVFGSAAAGCKGGAAVRNGSGDGEQTSGDGSVGGGNQVTAPISAPVNVCGNAATVSGDAVAGCKGGATVKNGGSGYGGGQWTSGRLSVLGGNQVTAPVKAPVDVCGNAAAVLGDAAAGCRGGQGGHGGGGYYGSRMSERAAGAPVGAGSPVVRRITKALPMNPAEALPARPELPVDPPQLPVQAPQLPVQAPQLPVQAPVAQHQRAAASPVDALPVNPRNVVEHLPVRPPVAVPDRAAAAPGVPAPSVPSLPGPVALPDPPEAPVVSDIDLPSVTQVVRPAAAGEPVTGTALSSGMRRGSLYVLAVGALLAAAAAVLSLSRRIRFGRR